MAHEMAHIRNNDLKFKGLANVIARLTGAFAFAGKILLLVNLPLLLVGSYTIPFTAIILLIVAPWLVNWMNLALSRTREFDADLEAARLTADPFALVNALQKLNQINQVNARWLNLFQRKKGAHYLRTHPTTAERVQRLAQLA